MEHAHRGPRASALLVGFAIVIVLTTAATARASRAYYWTEAHAERAAKTIHVHYIGEASTAAAQLREANQRLAAVKQQVDACKCGYDELSRALEAQAAAQDFYNGAVKGWPVVRSRCDGRGVPNRRYQFPRFRCTVVIDHNDDYEVSDVSIRPRSATRFTYRWL
jgi:hypothetical protein